MANLYELEQSLNRQKAAIGLVGGRLRLYEAVDAAEPISAHIDPSDWHIEIALREGYEPVRDRRTAQYAEKRGISDPLAKICEDILYHETGHWELPRGSGKGCPYDEAHHDLIQEATAAVLKRKGKQGLAGHVANAFEDVLDNTNCRLYTSHAGQVLFWNEQGMAHGDYTKFYEAFVRANLGLWGDRTDGAFLKRWYAAPEKAGKAAAAVLQAWDAPKGRGPEALKERVAYLYDKGRWERYAERFAEIMEPLLDEPQRHAMFGASYSGAGASGERTGQAGGESAFDKKLASPEGREKSAHSRYTAGRGPATNRDSYEQLDALYRRLARNIPVEIDTFTSAYAFPLAPWGREPFDPERHDLLQRRVKLGLQEDGTVGLHVNKGWIETDEVYKRNIRKFPAFRLALLDTSESMQLAPDNSENAGSKAFIPWGDKSKYHFALLGYYGIERFLQSQHIAPYVDAGAVNFSGETQAASGDAARKLLLTPQWGGTELDVDVLAGEVKGETFLLSLSDGDIFNWDDIRDAYKPIVTACASAHIQIGGSNAFSSDLESWGIPVYYVREGDDLARLMVKVASDRYKSFGKAGAGR
jgi:hypothetical protein